MKLGVLTETKRYFQCPNGCDHKFYVEHLFESMKKNGAHSTQAGPWYCDKCGKGWFLTLQFDGALALELTKNRHTTAWVTLEIPANNPHPIRFRVRNKYLDANDPAESAVHHRYFYEEGTCPTNWLSDVVEVEVNGDRDPHGFAYYVSTVLALDAVNICQECGCTLSDHTTTTSTKTEDISAEPIICGLCRYVQKGVILAERPKKLTP